MYLVAGKSITQKGDKLFTITPEQLFNGITKPKPVIADKIKQLRTIQSISPQQYRKLKVHLPYVVAANFNPPHRLTANFSYTQHFILDIDHLSQKEREIAVLKNELAQDPRVKLIFISPSGNGLKVLFELAEKCYDSGKYSLFYKVFAEKFASQYMLEQVVDKSTSDVTRACFISHDTEAYFNPDCIPIIISDFANFDELFEIRKQEKKYKKLEKSVKEKTTELINPLDDDKIVEIKKKLNPNIRTKREKQIFVPSELEDTIVLVKKSVQEHDIVISSIVNIHYGKKFSFELNKLKAEINLFYGKKGFTVINGTYFNISLFYNG